eukprot:10734092-Ditylum_brightwellii.AAC.1
MERGCGKNNKPHLSPIQLKDSLKILERQCGKNNRHHLSPIQLNDSLQILYEVSPEWQMVNLWSMIPSSTPCIKQLQEMCGGKRKRLEQLDFTRASIGVVNVLFPLVKIYGKNDPPNEQCTSAKKIREWQRMGRLQQEKLMEKEVAISIPSLDGNEKRKCLSSCRSTPKYDDPAVSPIATTELSS